MRKFLLPSCLLLITLSQLVVAQTDRLAARDSEWNAYQLPTSNFARRVTPEKNVVFRVPAGWKQLENAKLEFSAPHSAVLRIYSEKVADGYPLTSYLTAMMKELDRVPDFSESALVRNTYFQDLEARELSFEFQSDDGEIIRSINWITINGPTVFIVSLKASSNHIQELEPYLKAVVQSVCFVSPAFEFELFEKERAMAKVEKPGPVNEVEAVVATLNSLEVNRRTAVDRLAVLLESNPDSVVDLLLDRRPLVRAAAIEAIARSKNTSYEPFLWRAVKDDLLLSEFAARKLASLPNIQDELFLHSLSGFSGTVVARLWPFISKEKRLEVLQKVFSQTAVKRSTAKATKAGTNVRVTVSELDPVVPGQPIKLPNTMIGNLSQNPNVQINFLTLLADIPVEDFATPLTRLLAADHEPLAMIGLQVAIFRAEKLPIEILVKLFASSNKLLKKLALQSMAYSATLSEIPRVEGLKKTNSEFETDILLTVKEIRLRDQLESAKSNEAKLQLIKNISEPALFDFAWNFACEIPNHGCSDNTPTTVTDNFAIKPLGENLFPKDVAHYAALPNPGQAVEKFYESLRSIQMNSARAQSNLALLMGGWRQVLGNELNAPAEAKSLIEYTGLNSTQPIAVAEWTASGANNGSVSATRKAIVLRVNDRERFERSLQTAQSGINSSTYFTDYIALGSRMVPLVPGILPLSAKVLVSQKPTRPTSSTPLLTYSSIGYTTWNKLPIKIFMNRQIDSEWRVSTTKSFVLFLGDFAIVGNNLASIRDLLTKTSGEASLDQNETFKRVVAEGGDVIYFSDVASVLSKAGDLGELSDLGVKPAEGFIESGALKVLNSSWENSYRFEFKESEWARNLVPFQPGELTSPKELLPASTVAYYFMKLDMVGGWQNFSKWLASESQIKSVNSLLMPEIGNEVLSELGPECGVAVLDLPDFEDIAKTPWIAFCKLKTSKLSSALSSGKLFRNVGPTNDFAEVKLEKSSYFVGAKNGYLVIAATRTAVDVLNQAPGLAGTRDFSKSIEKAPEGVIALGGYNLEAAVAAANKLQLDGLSAQVANVVFSLASAFHSQNFYATATSGSLTAKSSVSMDREGRFAAADINLTSRGENITYATLEPKGVPITNQNRISSLVVKLRSKSAGPIESIREDIKTSNQLVAQPVPTELLLTVTPRRSGNEAKLTLPITNPELAQFVKSSNEFSADQKDVIEQAREIAGKDKDAWSVARKLGEWTFKNLTWKSVGTASASQTLATREADCSEFSQLYVSMARSLGLPARIVSGLAYSGDSFGGHAWVEVWVGRWIELDPTWGTDFVDATHIRNNSTALVTAAALNQVDIEVIDVRRTGAEFQKTSQALAAELVKSLAHGNRASIEAALDVELLADEFISSGEWKRMSEAEHGQLSVGYRRALLQVSTAFESGDEEEEGLRLLKVIETGDRAEAICLSEDGELVKLKLVNRQNTWFLVEVVNTDTTYRVVFEALAPHVEWLRQTRAGKQLKPGTRTEFIKALSLVNSNPTKSLEIIDGALKHDPKSKELRFLKTLAFTHAEKRDDAMKLLTELTAEYPDFAMATYDLAVWFRESESDDEKKKTLDLLKRYISLEPNDPRAHRDLGAEFEKLNDVGQAESAYRRALESDPDDLDKYLDLIQLFLKNDKLDQVWPVLEAAEKRRVSEGDEFGVIMTNLHYSEEYEAVEKLAAHQPERMKKSALANLALAEVLIDLDQPLKALPVLSVAIRLDKKSTDPILTLAEANRALSRWPAALKAVDDALRLEPENLWARYQRACILARLNRQTEAMKDLNTAVEGANYYLYRLAAEEDLKPLASLPGFKKLLLDAEKLKAKDEEPK